MYPILYHILYTVCPWPMATTLNFSCTPYTISCTSCTMSHDTNPIYNAGMFSYGLWIACFAATVVNHVWPVGPIDIPKETYIYIYVYMRSICYCGTEQLLLVLLNLPLHIGCLVQNISTKETTQKILRQLLSVRLKVPTILLRCVRHTHRTKHLGRLNKCCYASVPI